MPDYERICVTCSASEDTARLQKCGICSRWFCPDCAHRAYGGRKFCSPQCARGYYFQGEFDDDDDEDTGTEDE